MNKQAIENRIAGAGMSQAEFTAKVRRIMQKLALRYGGKQTGSVATGYTADGVSWSASIYRQNASNGEVAGRLDVTANGRTIRVRKSTPTMNTVRSTASSAFKNFGCQNF